MARMRYFAPDWLSAGSNVVYLITGYFMAKNLRAKIPATDTLIVRDVNEDASKIFVEEARETARSAGAAEDTYKVEIAGCPREVAEKSVRGICLVCVAERVARF